MTDDEMRAAAARLGEQSARMAQALNDSLPPEMVERLRHLAELPLVNPELADRVKAFSEIIDRMRGMNPIPRPPYVRQAIAKAAPAIKRREGDLLSPVIKAAQGECQDRFNATEVWPVLVHMCLKGHPVLIDVKDGNILWRNAQDEEVSFTLKNLRDRLRNWKKAQ